jgi:hypothetical protein
MRSLIVIGDSHLTTSKRLIEKLLAPKYERIEFIPNRFLKYKWWNIDENEYLHKFEIEGSRVRSRTIQVNPNEENHLLLVGLRLSGDGLLRPFGTLTHDKTPRLPYFDIEFSERFIEAVYREYIDSVITPFQKVVSRSEYKTYRWILSPHMSERAAYARLDNQKVKHLQYKKLQAIFNQAFLSVLNKKELPKDMFLTTDEMLENTGFNSKKYAITTREELDIHVSEDYYETIISRYARLPT